MRSTASTLFQTHGTVKDTQGQMRHTAPTTTLRYYVKVIPEKPPQGGRLLSALRHEEAGKAAFEGGTKSLTDERFRGLPPLNRLSKERPDRVELPTVWFVVGR
jgi:hypothetical protein